MTFAIAHSSTACVLLEIGSQRILTDPVLDSGSRKFCLGPLAWPTRHVGPAIDPTQLPPLDAVLLSHAHHLDNLDETGRAVALKAKRIVTTVQDAACLGDDAIGLEPWATTTIIGSGDEQIRITATPAKHGPWWLPGVFNVTGSVLEWDGQQHGALYISGDTVYFRGIREVAQRFKIGTAILHLGAVHFWPPWPPFFRFTFNAREAAKCAQLMNARTVIPIHYERSVWSHFRESVVSYTEAFTAVILRIVIGGRSK